jgi:hypothetical protein
MEVDLRGDEETMRLRDLLVMGDDGGERAGQRRRVG